MVVANDFEWGASAQRVVEQTALECLAVGSALILYRPLHSTDGALLDEGLGYRWEEGGKVVVATSWNPRLEMHILIKRAASTSK